MGIAMEEKNVRLNYIQEQLNIGSKAADGSTLFIILVLAYDIWASGALFPRVVPAVWIFLLIVHLSILVVQLLNMICYAYEQRQ